MEIFLNYKDVQFLVGCTESQAMRAVSRVLGKSDGSKSTASLSDSVDISKLDIKVNSFSDSMNGVNIVEYTARRIREKGIPDNMKREILGDTKCVLRVGLYGKYSTLLKILTKDQIDSLKESLQRRRSAFLAGKNKIPKSLERYAQ